MEKPPVEKPKIKEKETREKEPEIFYNVFYSPHRTAKDFEKLEKAFNKSSVNIYVPEMRGWKEEHLSILNKLSQGKLGTDYVSQIYSIPQGSHHFKEFQLIENSKKPILFIDYPREHELSKTLKKASELRIDSFMLFLKGRFQEALQKMHRHVKVFADFNSKREELMKENLTDKIQELIRSSPELKEKKEVGVLLRMGMGHTSIYHDLKRKKPSTSWEFGYQPAIFDSLSEAIRKITISKKINNELLARGIVEELLDDYFAKITDDSNKTTMIERKISSKLDLGDIKKISEELGEDSPKSLIECLERQSIKVPKTEKEMDRMLSSKD